MLKTIMTFFSILFCLTGCSWSINLVIANNSQDEVIVKYILPADEAGHQFFDAPDTYVFNDNLARNWKNANKLIKLQSNYTFSKDSTTIRITIKPGQAVHIGRYYSFQNRDSIISKYHLLVEVGKGTVTNFEHWKNIHTDLLTIK